MDTRKRGGSDIIGDNIKLTPLVYDLFGQERKDEKRYTAIKPKIGEYDIITWDQLLETVWS